MSADWTDEQLRNYAAKHPLRAVPTSDSEREAERLGYEYAHVEESVKPPYDTSDMSKEASVFWDAVDAASRGIARLAAALGPYEERKK